MPRAPPARRQPRLRRASVAVVPRRFIIEVLRVSGTSRPNAVAGAIAALLRSEGAVEVQAIGANAVNQAVKAIAVARNYLAEDNLDLATVPEFVKLELQNEERTAVRFTVKSIQGRAGPGGPVRDAGGDSAGRGAADPED